jgi:hypothetical protein
VSAPTDVEVTVLGADGKVVRHLAAGVLGGKHLAPEPLKAGLVQEILWDSKDDFGKPAADGPFKVRVRTGMGFKLRRLIGQDHRKGRVRQRQLQPPGGPRGHDVEGRGKLRDQVKGERTRR